MSLGSRYSQHSFSKVPDINIQRSKFDRSFQRKQTMNFDYLVPFFVDEILPGDTVNLNVNSFCRLATQAVPVLDNMYLDWFFFFVPNRLVWDNWERLNGAQDDPGDSTDYLVPVINPPTDNDYWSVHSLGDYFGVPTEVPNLQVNALPFRAYYLIWNEWFRDQNLQSSVVISKGDGPDTGFSSSLRKRAKKHDYFTSCLPWPQKGPAVSLSMSGQLPVYGHELEANVGPVFGPGHKWQAIDAGGRNSGPLYQAVGSGGTGNVYGSLSSGSVDAEKLSLGTEADYDGVDPLAFAPPYALVDDNLTATINQLRLAFMTQSLLERDARGGTRYVEILRSHFNVVSPDFRLQRPEHLASGSTRFNQHPVAQTSETTDTGTPQANLSAFATQSEFGRRIGFSKSFVEHGYVIGLVQARADVSYQQGLNRMWSRRTRFDFFWPELQQLGEQAVLNKEIYAQGPGALDPSGDPYDDQVFGYQERYAEYRYRPSEICGQFRSTFSQSLDVWTLAEEFVALPTLNSPFIQSNTPVDRVLVVPDEDYPAVLADFWFDYKHARPIMSYGVPATLGRF